MSHEIFGQRSLSREVLPWHQLGKVFTGNKMVTTAVKTAGCDYKVGLEQMGAVIDGKTIEVPGRSLIVRYPTSDDPEHRVFGEVASDHGVIDNLWLAEQFNQLSREWPVETVGALRLGKTFFFTLDAGNGSVGGEEVKNYFLVTDTKDGKTSLKIAFTPVRVVCQNTLSVGLKQATISGAIQHTKNIAQEIQLRAGLFGEMQSAQGVVMGAFEAMAKTILEEGDIAGIIEKAYPYPQKPKNVHVLESLRESDRADEFTGMIEKFEMVEEAWQREFERMDTFREACWTSMDIMNESNNSLAQSAWYAYNAVVEVEDFRKGPETTTPEAILFGSRARTKRRAFNEAYEMALVG